LSVRFANLLLTFCTAVHSASRRATMVSSSVLLLAAASIATAFAAAPPGDDAPADVRLSGPLDDYHVHKATALAYAACSDRDTNCDNTRKGGLAPAPMLMCGDRCGSVAPITLATAKSICSDNNGISGDSKLSNSCWGFSYDSDIHAATFAQGINSKVDTYMAKNKWIHTDPHGYNSYNCESSARRCSRLCECRASGEWC